MGKSLKVIWIVVFQYKINDKRNPKILQMYNFQKDIQYKPFDTTF